MIKITGSCVRELRARRLHDAARGARPAALRPSRRPLAARGLAAASRDRSDVRDSIAATFDDFVSMSIQHLVHEMGTSGAAAVPRAERDLVRGAEPPLGHRPGLRGRRAGEGLHGSASPLRDDRPRPATRGASRESGGPDEIRPLRIPWRRVPDPGGRPAGLCRGRISCGPRRRAGGPVGDRPYGSFGGGA